MRNSFLHSILFPFTIPHTYYLRLSNRVAFLFCTKGSETMANEWYRRMENRIIGSIDNEIKKQQRLEEQQKKRRGGDM